MINLVQGILQELQYSLSPGTGGDFSMLFKESEDYFIVAEYDPSELADFFNTEKTRSIISYFQKQKESNSAINKNTSLVILVKSDDLGETLETHRNNIFDIEEDEYILRKYVVVYTQAGLDEVAGKTIEALNESVKDVALFAKYQDHETRYTDQAYFLIMQLFVKLPPLSFTGYDNDFESVKDRIDSSIGDSGVRLVKHILASSPADVKENRSSLLEVNNSDFDDWLSDTMSRINDETA